MHGREHKVLNNRLAQHGYPTRGIDSYVRGLYWVRERIQTKKVNLAFTAALEHYTATLAELLLTDEEARKAVGKPGARDILTWHALEESEHKAVAYDATKPSAAGSSCGSSSCSSRICCSSSRPASWASSRSRRTATRAATPSSCCAAWRACRSLRSCRYARFASWRSTTG